MKKLFLLLSIALTLSVSIAFGQGLENFNNFVGSSGTYSDGTFVGQDGSTWTYTQCRSDKPIVAPSPCMGKARTPAANVYSGIIQNGCGVISFDYKQGYSTAVNLNLLINGIVVKTVTSPGGNGDTANVRNSGPVTVNVSGGFEIRFEQVDNTTSGQVSVDNVTWTESSGAPLPEPSFYPTDFFAVANTNAIDLIWTDSEGGQLPIGYLIKASEANNIVAPVDGIEEIDDLDFTDGKAVKNVMQGVQAYTFNNLKLNQQYFFKIYPYTNWQTDINYKTDGTPPSATASTPDVTLILFKDFANQSFDPWDTVSLANNASNKRWSISSYGGNFYAYINGYQATENCNDWLISPSMNFDTYKNETLSFKTATNYTGPTLEVKMSNDYVTGADPSLATWTPITATLSPGNYTWTPSGNIDISGISGSNVHLAYHYTTAVDAAAWEVDDIIITGVLDVGVPETEAVRRSYTIVPNPSDGRFNLVFNENSQKEVRVLSVVGQEVYRSTTNQTTLSVDIPNLSAGIYFIRVNSSDSGKTEVKKLIVR